MSRSVYVFTDLDDSLFQTRGKCGDGPLYEAAFDKDGAPLSYHTEGQLALLRLLADATLIPVTGRNVAALRRVRSMHFPWLRVTSHGALVLDADEKILPSWESLLKAELPVWEARFEEALELAQARIAAEGLALRARVIIDQRIPVYVSIKGDSKQIAMMAESFKPLWRDGVIHRNRHNMALLPPYASKARAVEHVMARILEEVGAAPLFVGVGDSVSDVPFLKLCHFAITPQGSQIHQETWA